MEIIVSRVLYKYFHEDYSYFNIINVLIGISSCSNFYLRLKQ